MAILKYAFENDVLVVSSKDDTRLKTFKFGDLPENIRFRLGLHGLKVILQQRTSQMRGKETVEEIVAAMADQFATFARGEWSEGRSGGGESRKVRIAFLLARALLALGKAKGSEGAIAAKLLQKKLDELEALSQHPDIREAYAKAEAEGIEIEEVEFTL